MKYKVHCLQHYSFVAQAAHWFDWSKMWPEVARILRKSGSAAFWVCYTLFALLLSYSSWLLIDLF